MNTRIGALCAIFFFIVITFSVMQTTAEEYQSLHVLEIPYMETQQYMRHGRPALSRSKILELRHKIVHQREISQSE